MKINVTIKTRYLFILQVLSQTQCQMLLYLIQSNVVLKSINYVDQHFFLNIIIDQY